MYILTICIYFLHVRPCVWQVEYLYIYSQTAKDLWIMYVYLYIYTFFLNGWREGKTSIKSNNKNSNIIKLERKIRWQTWAPCKQKLNQIAHRRQLNIGKIKSQPGIDLKDLSLNSDLINNSNYFSLKTF